MIAFARLLDSLAGARRPDAAAAWLRRYFRIASDPDRGWGVALLAGALAPRRLARRALQTLAAERIDPTLFALSQEHVGDLAETLALIWPAPASPPEPPPNLSEVLRGLDAAPACLPERLAGWLDRLDAPARRALLRLVTGGPRAGLPTSVLKQALAAHGGVPVARVEELWHGLAPPYEDLFAWLEGRAAAPRIDERAVFRPFMLANPPAPGEIEALDPADFSAEWKWDGVRVQVAGAARRLYTRAGDEIGARFPEIADSLGFDAVLDGALLIVRDGEAAPFEALQRRLGRKTAPPPVREESPARIRLYDILCLDGEDLRGRMFDERRARLEEWYAQAAPPRMDLSPLLPFDDWTALERLRAGARTAGVAGVMLKRRDSAYEAGRPRGLWFEWKPEPLEAGCVLMYATRAGGGGADYTFGCWRGDALVPVGKARCEFDDAEAAAVERWVRENTVERYGPVRSVTPGLVFEVAFDAIDRSTRRKSGLAMRLPSIRRIRWDAPPERADRVETLRAMLDVGDSPVPPVRR